MISSPTHSPILDCKETAVPSIYSVKSKGEHHIRRCIKSMQTTEADLYDVSLEEVFSSHQQKLTQRFSRETEQAKST